MGASADRTRLSIVKESAWGQTPSTPTLQKLNYTQEDINFDIKSRISDSKRSDRMTSDVILTSAGTKGGFDFEFQALASGAADNLLLGALFAEKWNGVNASDDASISAQGAVLTATTKTFDLSAVASLDATKFFVGKKIYFYTTTTNKGFYSIASITSPGVFVVNETISTNETAASGTLIKGQTIKNGLYKHSFTIEKFFEDVDEGFVYKGMVVDQLSIKYQTEKAVTGSFSFIGKDVVINNALIGSVYTDPPQTPFMSANFNVSSVLLDGVTIEECLLEGIDFDIKNNVDGKTAVGVFGYCRTREGEFSLTGKINLYFNNSTMYQKFIDNEAFSLQFTLFDNLGNYYIITLPRLKLSTDEVFSKGKNSDVMDNAKFAALAHNATNCMIQIDRFAGITA